MSLSGGSFADFEEKARLAASQLLSIKPDESLLLISHLDADGLSAGSIMMAALLKAGKSPHLRIVKQLDESVIKDISQLRPRFAVFTDMGSGQKSMLGKMDGTTPVIIDHHQPEKMDKDLGFMEVNAHLCGFDGSSDISASGTAFRVALKMDPYNALLAPLALVGALGDLQDKGERSTLTGINAMIAEEAEKAGLLGIKKGLKLYGFESRPLIKCMEYTLDPFLPGLSGDEGACFKLIKSIGIDPRRPDGSWKLVSDLSKEDLKQVINGVIKYLISQGLSSREAESIVGAIYVFTKEDADTPLRDAREFASSINACGRLGKYGLGISICLGDRSRALTEMKEVLQEYRKSISGYLNWLSTNKDATKILPHVQAIYGGTAIDDKIIGTLASIAFSIKPFSNDKPIIGFANSDNVVKVSARGTADLVRRGLNLGAIMKEASEKFGGAGGGHTIAAGAQIPLGKEDEFLRMVDEQISKTVSGVKL
ncbi:MAG: DHH family phosphoesterase [Candidatus Methanomethylicus sp.]|nr:DHH family phosphoesterase [Candidatus Methanomethylicus sp.]